MNLLSVVACCAALAGCAHHPPDSVTPDSVADVSLANSAASLADAHCVAAILGVAHIVNEQTPGGAAAGVFYYLGRIEGRSPDVSWQILAEGVTDFYSLTMAEQTVERAQCGRNLSATAREMQDFGTLFADNPDFPD